MEFSQQPQNERAAARRLPSSLVASLACLEASEAAAEWLAADLLSAYLLFKRAEIQGLENLSGTEMCRRYAEVY